jgi:hypothetical protein
MLHSVIIEFGVVDMVSLRELLLYSLVGGVEGKFSISTLAGPKAPQPPPQQRRKA